VRIRQQIAAAGVAGALGLTGLAVWAAPSAAQPITRLAGSVPIMASAAVAAPPGSIRLGDLAPAVRLRLAVTLRLPHPAALAAFVAAVTNPRSPSRGQFLRRGQFGPRFGPTLARVDAVRAALAAAGLSPGPTAPDRLSIPVTASASAISHAFGISLVTYRLPAGRIAYANSRPPRLPAAIAPYVSGILGLSDVYLDHDDLGRQLRLGRPGRDDAGQSPASPGTAGPRPCSAASKAGAGHTIDDFASRYWMSPLYRLGDRGGGVHVAVFEQEPDLTSDISAYEKCYGVDTTVNYDEVDGGAGAGPGDGEAALDIENIIGLSPDVTVDVYQGPNNSDVNTYDIYDAIISADQDQVISTSWGDCELATNPVLITSEDTVFEEAAADGQTLVAAAGDSGSTGCYQRHPAVGILSVQDPASQPDVVAVGGTTIAKSADVVWNDSDTAGGAGGGGVSALWCMPGYQYQLMLPGLISKYSVRNSACSTAADGSYMRQVPDVSAASSQESGYLAYYDGGWTVLHGTGGAAPLWASVAALVDASPFCQVWGDANVPGALSAGLYYVAGQFASYVYGQQPEGLQDVTRGSNVYAPAGYRGTLYPATTGYDMASGLGTPLVSGINRGRASTFYPGLAALMCLVYSSPPVLSASVSTVAPGYGPRNGKQLVTVTGSGFVPIAGADFAQVGNTWVAATCASTTECTFQTPKGQLGTVDIKINAEDLGPSKVTSADHYRYVAVPTISSLSPSSGPPSGQNTVTIHGSAFYGTVTVHFGKKLGTHVRVASLTKLTVTAPAGSGTVKVTVTAAGGTSAARLYRY
jgi:subtilase family serine protease